VFISHSTEDKWIAKWICERINNLNTRIDFFRDDRDIAGGDNIPATIMQAMHRCQEVIVLLTPNSIRREWITMEVAMAAVLSKRIIPLFYGVQVPADFPILIKETRGFHLNDFEQYLLELGSRGHGNDS